MSPWNLWRKLTRIAPTGDRGPLPVKDFPWSPHPGCFERHLQRRYQNVLFPPERRNVTMAEFWEARAKDAQDAHDFHVRHEVAMARGRPEMTVGEVLAFLREIGELLVRAAEIGGELGSEVRILEATAAGLREALASVEGVADETIKGLEVERALWTVLRHPFIAQCGRRDTPISKGEELSSCLCEDAETIRQVAYMIGHFPGWQANMQEQAVRIINRAVGEGLDPTEVREKLRALGVTGGAAGC